MDTIKIHGGVSLQGKVRIQGSKNAVLPVLAAVLLTDGESVLHNVPKISDVYHMLQILRSMGCRVSFSGNTVRIANVCKTCNIMPAEAIKGMRSSICLLGTLLGKTGKISMDYPGGCVIGKRPIDLHLKALEQMGACFVETPQRIEGYTYGKLHGTEISLPTPSVGATENIILAAVLSEGTTVIRGAAKEPEIVWLCSYLNRCGAEITGMGSDSVKIKGVSRLEGCEFTVPCDRIVAGTYMLMTAMAGGCVLLEGAPVSELDAVIGLTEKMGCDCQILEDGIFVQAPEHLKRIDELVTAVYPGFPTDLQSVVMAAALRMPGITHIQETIFENRFQIVPQLKKMGAQIDTSDAHNAFVTGGRDLSGCLVSAGELRGGAALVAAGLVADGITTVTGCAYIDRGYENICKDLRELGARIYRDK